MESWTSQSEMKKLRICFWGFVGFLFGKDFEEGIAIPRLAALRPKEDLVPHSLIPTRNLKLLRKTHYSTFDFAFFGDWKLCFCMNFHKKWRWIWIIKGKLSRQLTVFCESEWVGNWLKVEWLGSHGTFQVRDSSTCSRDAFMWFPREIGNLYKIFRRANVKVPGGKVPLLQPPNSSFQLK